MRLLAPCSGISAQRPQRALVRVIDAAAQGVCDDCAQAGGEGRGQRTEVGKEGCDGVAGEEGGAVGGAVGVEVGVAALRCARRFEGGCRCGAWGFGAWWRESWDYGR